jgi:hypothetical protein
MIRDRHWGNRTKSIKYGRWPRVLLASLMAGELLTGCSGPRRHERKATSAASAQPPAPKLPPLSAQETLAARRKFTVELLGVDAHRIFGVQPPWSDRLQLRITNGSNVTLPFLTVLTRRWSADGTLLGESRVPSLIANEWGPGSTTEIDYYSRGHLNTAVARFSVEIEPSVDDANIADFRELGGRGRPVKR